MDADGWTERMLMVVGWRERTHSALHSVYAMCAICVQYWVCVCVWGVMVAAVFFFACGFVMRLHSQVNKNYQQVRTVI